MRIEYNKIQARIERRVDDNNKNKEHNIVKKKKGIGISKEKTRA